MYLKILKLYFFQCKILLLYVYKFARREIVLMDLILNPKISMLLVMKRTYSLRLSCHSCVNKLLTKDIYRNNIIKTRIELFIAKYNL